MPGPQDAQRRVAIIVTTTNDRDYPLCDRNIPTMSEITLHNIASVSAIWLVDKPLRWHLNSIFGKRTVNAFWGCMERTHGITESQASTCWMCCVQKLKDVRNSTLLPYLWASRDYIHKTRCCHAKTHLNVAWENTMPTHGTCTSLKLKLYQS